MDAIAESYVKLVLAVGRHDADYVDAYFGPAEWRAEVEREAPNLDQIRQRAVTLRRQLNGAPLPAKDPLIESRRAWLAKSLESLLARVELLQGDARPFDEEAAALFDAVPPAYGAEHFEPILARLDSVLPGEGALIERLDSFRRDFVIAPQKLDAVFRTAIDACRERTQRHIALPTTESFEVEYVTGKSWSGYNWYKGNYQSLIQVNTDLPITIDRALDLACHEGYPGHHVFNVVLEEKLLRERGWREYSVYPLFSPRSLIAEGTANFGIEVAFPAEERLRFERQVLFPAAGLDPARAGEYYAVYDLTQKLGYAGNEAARRYLDDEIDAEAAVEWLTDYAMMPSPRARQRLAFIEQYRSYVINYNLGLDLVRAHVEGRGGTPGDPQRRWQLFAELLSDPRLPSELQ